MIGCVFRHSESSPLHRFCRFRWVDRRSRSAQKQLGCALVSTHRIRVPVRRLLCMAHVAPAATSLNPPVFSVCLLLPYRRLLHALERGCGRRGCDWSILFPWDDETHFGPRTCRIVGDPAATVSSTQNPRAPATRNLENVYQLFMVGPSGGAHRHAHKLVIRGFQKACEPAEPLPNFLGRENYHRENYHRENCTRKNTFQKNFYKNATYTQAQHQVTLYKQTLTYYNTYIYYIY